MNAKLLQATTKRLQTSQLSYHYAIQTTRIILHSPAPPLSLPPNFSRDCLVSCEHETLFPGQRACECIVSAEVYRWKQKWKCKRFSVLQIKMFSMYQIMPKKMIESPFPHRILIALRQRRSIFHIQFELDTSVCWCCCELWLAIASISSAHKSRDKDEKQPKWFNEHATMPYTTRITLQWNKLDCRSQKTYTIFWSKWAHTDALTSF